MQHGQYTKAYSAARSAECLGGATKETEALLAEIQPHLPDLLETSHNRYYRLYSLAKAIRKRTGQQRQSVLDVGGAEGELARYIPEHDYCLAEPLVNGIAGEALPFAEGSFDWVVSCHVLEHIPVNDRGVFLDSLLKRARKGLILLNPFHVEGTNEVERLQLILDITGAPWAQEHLDCILPRTEELEDYARSRGLTCILTPNATIPVSFATVWVDFFSSKARMGEAWRRINRYMNTSMVDHVDSPTRPTAYVAELLKP